MMDESVYSVYSNLEDESMIYLNLSNLNANHNISTDTFDESTLQFDRSNFHSDFFNITRAASQDTFDDSILEILNESSIGLNQHLEFGIANLNETPNVVDYIDLCSPSPNRRANTTNQFLITKNRDNNVATERHESQNSKEMLCRICYESLLDRITMTTQCGHLFCKTCLDQALTHKKVCPMCNRALNKNRIVRIYF